MPRLTVYTAPAAAPGPPAIGSDFGGGAGFAEAAGALAGGAVVGATSTAADDANVAPAAGAEAGADLTGALVASMGSAAGAACSDGTGLLSRSSVATWSGSLTAAAVLEPALAASGPTLRTRVCISPLGSGGIFTPADCCPESERPGNSIGTKITANAISTAAPSKRFFKPESMGMASRIEFVSVLSGAPWRARSNTGIARLSNYTRPARSTGATTWKLPNARIRSSAPASVRAAASAAGTSGQIGRASCRER